MIDTKEQKEKYILVGIFDRDEEAAEASLSELSELAETAGADTACTVLQHLEHPNASTYVGKGKVAEITVLIRQFKADGIICDDELTPVQIRNLSEILDVKVLDRTILILDIFASHASTAEGKLQVETAQLQYRASHLAGMGKVLSRLGGGIGTRGPGETKLETDRRAIRRRLGSLNEEIRKLSEIRKNGRKKRLESSIPVAAIVGYTNAGKSTLLNSLTDAGIPEEDKLFATLDPTTRLCTLPPGQEILLTDTVGFINKLPHNLIDAFKSTLEEAKYADMLLHVVDASDPDMDSHMEVVYKTLKELEIIGKPVLTLFNKMDLVASEGFLKDDKADITVKTSLKTGMGKEQLLEGLGQLLLNGQKHIDMILPYSEADKLSKIRSRGRIIREEYLPEGIGLEAYIPESIYVSDKGRLF
ncbi:MAG: GTPase HflX [Lachnospiraceae bacterium]|nr:GTPase HflX [Lachnospiraceae bacterium]